MQPGDLVKYIGEGWPRNGTLGIVLANRSLAKDAEVDQIDQTYSVKVHWSAKSGGEAAWEDPRTLAPAAVAEIYFK
mgnify:CR=1 FL=1